MKAFEILDEERDCFIGVLLYYEKESSYIVELSDELDEWSAPLLFTSFVKKNIYTIPRDISFIWVKERIVPSERQNIKSILKNHKLKQYDEFKLLELSYGKCSQDNMYIRKIEELPEFIVERMKKNISECIICDDNDLLLFFNDGKIKKVNLKKLGEFFGADKIIKNRQLLESGKVATGGYSVTFNDSMDIPAYVLYQEGADIPLRIIDFISFLKKNILDTSECCGQLECSRQNLSYMIKQEQLTPVREEVRGNLFLKGEVLKNKW